MVGSGNSNSTNRILFSLIVPVYNTEKYLGLCLDSLLDQDIDKTQYEIICINDGSTDNSISVLKEYADKYENIVLIDKPNSGVSATRNLALEKACGEYIWFIDSDDWIARNCLGTFARLISENKPSAIFLEYNKVQESQCEQYKKYVFDKSLLEITQGAAFYIHAVCMAIIKKELIDLFSLRFIQQIAYGEDTIFMGDLLEGMRLQDERQGAKNIKLSLGKSPIYFYRTNEGSATSRASTTNKSVYFESMLSRAKLYRDRANISDMPEWYIERYKLLHTNQMAHYMLFCLPTLDEDLDIMLQRLNSDKLYPCEGSAKALIGKPKGIKGKLVGYYRRIAFRYPLVYRLYYKQTKRKAASNAPELP